MENWVDPQAISIAGYRPRTLGETEAQAVAGLQERMQGLISFSKTVGERAKPLVEADQRAEVEPIVLESALETSRVSADLLHTLGVITFNRSIKGRTVRGRVESGTPPELVKMPAKIVLGGTRFSTLTDARGRFELRGLPAGEYPLAVIRAGDECFSQTVDLSARNQRLNLSLRPHRFAGNLLRNPDFALSWVAPGAPDTWSPGKLAARPAWESELVPVSPGQTYRLMAEWKEGSAESEVVLRWRTKENQMLSEEDPLQAPQTELTRGAPEKAKFAQVIIIAPKASSALRSVGLMRKPQQAGPDVNGE